MKIPYMSREERLAKRNLNLSSEELECYRSKISDVFLEWAEDFYSVEEHLNVYYTQRELEERFGCPKERRGLDFYHYGLYKGYAYDSEEYGEDDDAEYDVDDDGYIDYPIAMVDRDLEEQQIRGLNESGLPEPPTTYEGALAMVCALDPRRDAGLLYDRYVAYERLKQFFRLVLPD